ncbi:MAG: alpha/beta hydrolase domain-containing protein, partial [Bryobacteraceae bacterium]
MCRFLLPLLLCACAQAGLVRIEVAERSDVLEGRSFRSAGPYERIVGRAYFAVDPKLPANRIIADIDLAPRNDAGLVEFSSDIYVLKPRDPAKGNGAVLYEVSNRGRKGMLSMFNRGTTPANLDPRTEAHFGDGFLMDRGFTLVWLGWQFDVQRAEGLMRLYTPTAGKKITGLVRSEFIPDKKEYSHSLADRTHIPYPAIDLETATLTVRDRNDAARRAI